MENLKKVNWFNQPNIINENFEAVENAIDVLEASAVIEPQANVANIGATTNITTVPASFAALSDVQSYLAGANVIPNIEQRMDNLETKINSILAALRAAGILEV